ncbi:hypothetical protein [Aliikangiella maris]|uniref:Uncharacterized protein n=2 Tax=Aliikangiella maris TaxID=3162458 RepID=A0ABV3MNN3_9GAMM
MKAVEVLKVGNASLIKQFKRREKQVSLIIEKIDLQAIGNPPQVTCDLCKTSHVPMILHLTPAEWLHAVDYIGWRQVEFCSVKFELLCPDCLSSLKIKEDSTLSSLEKLGKIKF